MNQLYYGDCLTVMQDIPAKSVDLIYLDPPFNSNRDYNAIYKDETGRALPDQIEAFGDLWELDVDRERAIRNMPLLMHHHGTDTDLVQFWKGWTHYLRRANPRLLAYLSYMTERLLPMRALLKTSGFIFLHCDPTASHYIKVVLDSIFGHRNFRNEIIWRRTNAKGLATTRLPANHDVVLAYAKSKQARWNPQFTNHDPEYIEKFYRYVEPETGRRYQLSDLVNPNKNRPNLEYEFLGIRRVWRWSKERMERAYQAGLVVQSQPGKVPRLKRYLDEQQGRAVDDLWSDIKPAMGAERLGYATQKPLALLERIITAGSKPGDVVFDPFCGCATTLEAAHRLERKWIGIDLAIHAIKRVASVRLQDKLGLVEGRDFEISGVPRTLEGARDLWERDKYQFQKWAVEEVDGFVTARKTADGGIDGRLYFSLPEQRDLESMVLEVKGGKNLTVAVVRDLRGVLEREEALLAGLIVMDDLGPRKTANFAREMAAAGDLEVKGVPYPRMQLLTVAELLEGKRFLTPSVSRASLQPALPLG